MESLIKVSTVSVLEGISSMIWKRPVYERKELLDPLTTLIRLSLLVYMPEGSKISIHNNCIFTQTPTIMQGTLRWSQGDKREDLHNLNDPVEAAAQWYSCADTAYNLIFTMAVA